MSDPLAPPPPALTAAAQKEMLRQQAFAHVIRREPRALAAVLPALNAHPNDPAMLLLATIAALVDERPEQSLRYLHRFTKRFAPLAAEDQLLRVIALAQQGIWGHAAQLIKQHGLSKLHGSIHHLPGGWQMMSWYHGWTRKVERAERRRAAAEKQPGPQALDRAATRRAAKRPAAPKSRPAAKTRAAGRRASAPAEGAAAAPGETAADAPPPLPRAELKIPLVLSLPDDLDQSLAAPIPPEPAALGPFRLRSELIQLGLLQGFDELLCLPLLRGVETFWYQVEAVRKVLKQFRGRVLLADEVGLGKTVEAGMVLKEYLLRGMVERVLVLAPPSLVGQWREEMTTKFDVSFATSHDPLLRNDPPAFWAQPRVIASIAAARRAEHHEILAQQQYDLVIVDEAHHLKNRATANWKLVNALNRKFLLLLSATPVQNSLVELYNLLTLLKPGIFKTEKEFRASYMTSGRPRIPANRDRMRDLMRDVMIRNTRSLVDVKLPPRHATTWRLEPTAEEAACYHLLTRLVQVAHQRGAARERLSLRHLLSAAGSTPTTAAGAIDRYLAAHRGGPEWDEARARYAALGESGKERALAELLRRNPDEKKMVFVRHRETLLRLAQLMERDGVPHVLFEGGMSGPEKDEAVARFRDEVPLFLSTESGGEGRNLQFCNTLVNFDLPWNPMAIEQRIGRIHRIGQTREVFIFNLAVRGTLEEHVLGILDEKINMFELVIGELDAILGEMDDEQDFADLVFAAWVETTEAERAAAFAAIGQRLADAKRDYEAVKALDEELFGEEFMAG